MLHDAGSGDRRLRGKTAVEHADRRGDIARRGHVRVRRQVLAEPAVALRVGDGVGRDDLHIGQRGATGRHEHEVDRHQVLADDPQARQRGQCILRGRDAALDRVLDRDHRGVAAALEHVGERLADVVHGAPVLASCFGDLFERRFGERSGRAEIAVGAAFSHAFHLRAPVGRKKMRGCRDGGRLSA